MRKIHKNVPVCFEGYPDRVVETNYSQETNKNNETIFSIGNGYLGVRGFSEEGFYGDPAYADETTMINGIYEYHPYRHIWCRPGFPERFHAITNQANPLELKVLVDGEEVSLAGKVSEYSRTLLFSDGTVTRKFIYESKSGKNVRLEYSRFALQQDKHLLAMRVKVTPLQACEITLLSRLSSVVEAGGNTKEECADAEGKIFRFLDRTRTKTGGRVRYQTRTSGFSIACAIAEAVDFSAKTKAEDEETSLVTRFEVAANADEILTYTRVAGFATNRDFEDFGETISEKTQAALLKGYDKLLAENRAVWRDFWDVADVEIKEDPLVQQGIRFSMMQIYQSCGKDGITNISANGLTGTGYSGHTFWDTEIFILPMFLYTVPEIAKELIVYRYNILDKARERARQMQDQGALFSWNSINGEECGHVFEAATAQYHINNAVFYAIYRYMEATGDEAFLKDYCAEILFEISKCMAHRGSFIPLKGNKFCINVICGPDEYNPVVDNNCYTNMLTQKQLYYTLEVADLLQKKYPERFAELYEKCGLSQTELDLWKRAADNMYIPYSKELDMYMQDDNFLYKDPIDIDAIPVEELPLLTHMHPLNLWRFQVCKQADLVLLIFLLSEQFTPEMRKKIFDFYEARTIHDSSLSAGIHSIVACDVGYASEAYDYLRQSCRMDLDNVNRNTFFGLHAACMGSSWMMLVNGYAGLRIYDGALHFKPYCAEKWSSFCFKIRFRGNVLKVTVFRNQTSYELLEGDSIRLYHKDETLSLRKGETKTCKND